MSNTHIIHSSSHGKRRGKLETQVMITLTVALLASAFVGIRKYWAARRAKV